jgi:hypothetical protein
MIFTRQFHGFFATPLVILTLVWCPSSQAQLDFGDTRTAKEIIDSYPSFEEAVLEMTREEWEVVRAWDEFDEVAYLTFLHKYHDSFDEKRAERKELRMKVLQQDGACGCWVEPDDSYITMVPPPGLGGLGPNEMAWANQGGAGWNVDCSSDPIPVSDAGEWQFELYGDNYNNFYVNSKGQISFGGDVIDWTPTGFPAAEYNQIAGYWQDTDLRTVGEIKWKKTQDAVYVNYIDVGYYNNQSDLLNSFQIIITHPESGILPDGNNAQVCYLDMDWAHGDVGGGGGCCGTDPGVTGADGESTNPNPNNSPHVQFGRFNLLDDTYNGPYGIGEGNEDGINWLDYKFFNINTALTNNNLNPVPTANLGCDTVTLCLTQTTPLNVEFLGPEPDQTVSLVVNSDLAGSCYIENESSSNGGTATYTGVFVAESPGISTVTMTAEDSDGAITEVNIVIQVLDVVPPTIDVTSATGEWGICAGSELDVTAASVGGQEPVVDWSWNLGSQFWTDNEATIPFGGTFVVTGSTASGCVVRELFEVFQTPYYLPTVEGTLQTVCPGDSAFVEVIPDVNENFVDYIWTGNWNNGGGTVLSTNGASAYLTAGVYQVTVVDEGGCEGKRTFILSPSASTLPDITIDPLCGEAAFDTVTFSGGFASPGEGHVNLYLSSSINGWGGSFLSIDIIHEDGTVTTSTVTMNSGNFANVNNNPDLAVAFGDSVQITFVSSDPTNDQYLGLDLYNCVNNCINNPSACFQDIPLTSGVIYYGPAMCTVQPAFGLWEETSNLGNNEFSVTDQYNTTWWATEYGMYELCFYDEECGSATCYDVEVNEPPTIELSGDSLAWACDGDDLGIQAFITDPADVATVNWPYPGTDNVLENEYSWTQYTETTLVVSVSNGCGTASDQIEVTATLEPLLDNAFLCGEGSTLELDPIPGDQNTDLVYEWTYNGNPANVQDNEWEVDATGSYCVTVVNGCFPNGNSDCAFIDVIEEIDVDVFPGGAITDCDGGGIEVGEDGVLGVSNAFIANYNDYTVTWPDGTVTTIDDNFNWIVPEETDINGTEICVTIEDPYGCDPQEACGLVFIGDVPTWDPLPNIGSEPLALCPGTPELFDLNAQMNGPEYSDYTWTVQCSDTVVSFDAEIVVNLFNDQFPPNCWGYPLDLEVTIANPCLPGGLTHVYNIIVDNCEIIVPNVFTPRDGNDENNGFHIMGLEPWEPNGVLVRIFDRWGNQVYENFQYRNATPWYGDESADGVYFYTVLLPNGDQHTGTVNIFRAR